MRRGVADGVGRWGVALAFVLAAAFVPMSQGAAAAVDSLTLTPVADAYVASATPTTNYGATTQHRARVSKAETFVRFNLAAWQGLRISTLTLKLQGVSGDASPLRLATTGGTWLESAVVWESRPSAVSSVGVAPVLNNDVARFDLESLFPSGFVDKLTLSLRVATPNDELVTFGSRETVDAQPVLKLEVASRTDQVDLPATADTYANASLPTSNFGSASTVKVNTDPKKPGYLKFDLSAWVGRPYSELKLRLPVTFASAPTVNVYRVGTGWDEATLNWNNRPTGGSFVAAVTTSIATGTRVVDVAPAFSSRTVEDSALALRLSGEAAAALAFSSRESGAPAVLRLTPAVGTPDPDPSGSPNPTVGPTPTVAPTATPRPTSPPTQLYFFKGYGTDHGAGMPQYGAKGRAERGQAFNQILKAYYTGVTLDPLPPEKMTIRVQLASSFVPTELEPARVIARGGAWRSEAFPDQVFPAESYLDMVFTTAGVWKAKVYDATGDQLASAETVDLTMVPAEPATLMYMKFRDSLRRYDLYRGSMRLRINGSGVQAINVVNIDDYVQGVIAAEMIPSWPLEALKAQAVAARSYGAGKIRTTGYYDVVPTSANQVYGGVNMEYPKTKTAAQETAGIVIWYNDKIANAYFFDTAGGSTENSEYVWPTGNGNPGSVIPYIRGIDDVDGNGVPFEIEAGRYEWSSGQFTMGQLSNIYAKDSRTNVGTITKLTYWRGVSGRLYRVVLEGTAGTKQVEGAVFKNIYNNNLLSGISLKSTKVYLTPVTP